MNRIPNKIDRCPINEAVLEIRFSSNYPVDAIFGALYAKIKDVFDKEVTPLPILQLPETVRAQDPNLKYQAYHKISKDNITLNIGPRVLTFVNVSPYVGWDKWSSLFVEVLGNIIETGVVETVERIGLRYINLFDENIFGEVKCKVELIGAELGEESTHLRTEIVDGKFIKVLQIGNSVNVITNGTTLKKSVIDIDCLYNIEDSSFFFDNYKEIINDAHTKEKELFFSLLKESFLEKLNPEYEEQL